MQGFAFYKISVLELGSCEGKTAFLKFYHL
jgi:hypothetical protein